MTGIAGIDSLVRLAGTDSKPTHGELLYGVDQDTGQIYQKKIPLLRKRKTRRFIVAAKYSSKPAVGETDVINVHDFASSRDMDVTIEFEFFIPSNGLETFLNFVSSSESPEDAVLSAIEEAAHAYIFSLPGKKAAFLNDYSEHSKKLTRHIESKLFDAAGIQLLTKLNLKHQEQLGSHPIPNLTIPIRLKDNANEHSVTFDAELGVMQDALVDAICAYPSLHKLKEKLIKVIIAYFSSEVSFHVFNNGFVDIAHQRDFENRLNQILRKEGRALDHWTLKTNIKGGKAKHFIPIEIEILCKPHESKKPITIKNKIHFILQDAGVFHKANVINLEDWAEKEMKTIIAQETLKKTYLDFLLEFDDIEKRLKNRLELASSLIGYSVKHLVSKPDLPEYKFTELAPYVFDYTDLPTKSASITANLRVSVSFSIAELRNVERWLNTNTNLEKAIETSIETELKKELQKKKPEDVYMRFSQSTENDESLEQTLSKAVLLHLESQYHATVDGSPNIVPSDTELGSFVQTLTNQILEFEFPVGREGSDEHYTIKGSFAIEQPDKNGWERIRHQEFTAQDVRDYFVKAAKAKFSIPSLESLLRYQSPQEREHLEETLEEYTKGEVSAKFGVLISITNFERTYSVGETKMDSVMQKESKRQRLYAKKEIELELARLEYASKDLDDAHKLKAQANKIRLNELIALGKQIEKHAEGDDDESDYIVKTKKAQLTEELAKSDAGLRTGEIERRLKKLKNSAKERKAFDKNLWPQQGKTTLLSKDED